MTKIICPGDALDDSLMDSLEKCDFRGCSNQAYREVDYFKDRRFRNETARKVVHLGKEDSIAYFQLLVRTRETAWSFLCRKHFTQERDAGRIIGWCGILTE
jgi:hypothetical protein